jgi:hypothetical protein
MRDRPAGEILAGIAADVQGFARNEPPNDDITLLVFKYLGAGHDHGAGEDSGAGAGGGLEAAQGRA